MLSLNIANLGRVAANHRSGRDVKVALVKGHDMDAMRSR